MKKQNPNIYKHYKAIILMIFGHFYFIFANVPVAIQVDNDGKVSVNANEGEAFEESLHVKGDLGVASHINLTPLAEPPTNAKAGTLYLNQNGSLYFYLNNKWNKIGSAEEKLEPVLWYDATDLDADGQIEGAYEDGMYIITGYLSTWKDKSKSKLDATITNSLSNPTYILDAVNGKAAVRFDGSTSHLVSQFNLNASANSKITIVSVFRKLSQSPDDFDALFGNDNGGWDRFCLLNFNGVLPSGVSNGTGVTPVTNLSSEDTFQIMTIVYDNGTIDGSGVFINGAKVATFTEDGTNEGYSNLTLGAINPGGFYAAKVDIAEFKIYDSVLTDEERTEVKAALKTKYGL